MPCKPTLHRPAGARPAAEVKRELDRERPSAARRGYDGRWRKARAQFLAEHPLCASCEAEGRVSPATVVDHVTPHKGDPDVFWDRSGWAPLCAACHSRKTVGDGRWGREVAVRRRYGCDANGMPLDPEHPGHRADGGGRVFVSGSTPGDRPPRPLYAAAKFRRGVLLLGKPGNHRWSPDAEG